MIDVSKIPSAEEFSNAESLMRQRLKVEAEYKSMLLGTIPKDVPCHDVWVWSSNKRVKLDFIFPTNSDLDSSISNGQRDKILDIAVSSFDASFFESVDIEYHSHEYVKKYFNGNYDKYFR